MELLPAGMMSFISLKNNAPALSCLAVSDYVNSGGFESKRQSNLQLPQHCIAGQSCTDVDIECILKMS